MVGLAGFLVDAGDDLAEELGEAFALRRGEASEDEFDVAETLAKPWIISAEAEAREILGMEVFGDGFEAIVAAARTVSSVAEGAEGQLKIVADDEDVVRLDAVESGEVCDGDAGFVIESLGLDEDVIAVFEPNGVEFGLLPGLMLDGSIEIQRQKTVVVAGEVVFVAWVAETDDEFHGFIIAYVGKTRRRGWMTGGYLEKSVQVT